MVDNSDIKYKDGSPKGDQVRYRHCQQMLDANGRQQTFDRE